MHASYTLTGHSFLRVEDDSAPVMVFVNPDAAEKRQLVEEFKLDEHTLSSALDPDELPRLEFEPEHVAVIFKRPRNYSGREQFLFKVASVGAFVFEDKLIMVTSEDLPPFEGMRPGRVRSPLDLLFQLVYRSITHFREHLKVFSMISDEMQDRINTAMENRYLINLFTLEKSMVYYLYAITSNGMLIEKLKANAAKMRLTTEQAEFLDDVLIENTQCSKQAEIYSNILAGLMDARASVVSNNLNVLMKTLNIITICIMVPTLVVSTFSMNVQIPFQKNPYAFWIILSLTLFSAGVVMSFWRYKKW